MVDAERNNAILRKLYALQYPLSLSCLSFSICTRKNDAVYLMSDLLRGQIVVEVGSHLPVQKGDGNTRCIKKRSFISNKQSP